MEYMTMEQAVKEIEKNVPSKKQLIEQLGPVAGLKKYQSIKALTSHSKSGQLGAGRFNQFAEEYGGGKYRAALVVFREI